MYFFVIRVLADPQDDASGLYPEAYVSAWINDTNKDKALEKATALIETTEWKVTEIIEDYPISREDYFSKPEGLEYYEQALIDGEVIVIFVTDQGM